MGKSPWSPEEPSSPILVQLYRVVLGAWGAPLPPLAIGVNKVLAATRGGGRWEVGGG